MIEKAHYKDATEIAKIIAKEFPYKNYTEKGLLERLNSGKVAIFKKTIGNSIAGFVEVEMKGNFGMINAISVKEKYRKKGFGKELLSHAIFFLKASGVPFARLLVKEQNKNAKNLYVLHGFSLSKIHDRKIEGSIVEVWEKNLQEEEEYLN
ncbi:MAG TPA: GNAT family N-acetyltransferase [archaeon]|nr:GNAT family N-acetyltransferase [archaeon]